MAVESDGMPKFRKKPVVIEAEQFKGQSHKALCDCHQVEKHIHTLGGEVTVRVDDWIIKGVQGGFYPCKPDIFEATYERVK